MVPVFFHYTVVSKYKLYPFSNTFGENIILRGREPVKGERIGLNVICEYYKTVEVLQKGLGKEDFLPHWRRGSGIYHASPSFG